MYFVLFNLKKGLATRVFELELGETGGSHLCNAGVRELEGFSQVFSRSFVQSDVRLGDYRWGGVLLVERRNKRELSGQGSSAISCKLKTWFFRV